jgi:predicted transglutaminase-like cysteine proteinase
MTLSKFSYKSFFLAFIIFFMVITLGDATVFASKTSFPKLFGYNEIDQKELEYLPQWIKILDRHPAEDFDQSLNKLHNWFKFLDSIKELSPVEQIKQVNNFANEYSYIIDMRNYGMADYWAIVKEFLYNFGDCEDYSITKFFSLRYLGFPKNDLRIVILQDTNLGVAHAVLAVAINGDILILDNQSKKVISHKDIVHYTPLYSVNEQQWWLHLPPSM